MIHRVVLVCACLVLAETAPAQTVTGTILGTVMDESRAVLPGVTATITSPVLRASSMTATTDEQGRYRFAGLEPGTYTLTLTLQGFSNYSEELRVLTGGTVERNVSLQVGTITESVTVSGQTPMVDTRSAAVASTSTREVIENLPTIRTTVTDFVQATPGVAQNNPGAYNEQIQVMGSPSNETTYVHDGVVINHPRTGNTWQGGDIDSVEEIQTVALGASAEWASTAGGVVNIVTKSGTNAFHGDATGYWKPNRLQSHPIKLPCNCPDGETGFNLGEMRDLTAHVGGPLRADKLWYYGGVQYYKFTYANPGTYPPEQPTSFWNRYPVKVTWQVNPTWRVTSLLHLEWWGGYSTGPTRTVALEAATKTDVAHIHSYGEEIGEIFGNSTALTIRAGGWWEPNQHSGSVTGDEISPSHTDNLTGLVTQGVPQISRQIMRRDAQSIKLDRFVAGQKTSHNLRVGLQLERAHGLLQSAFPSGEQYYDFGGASDYQLLREPSVQGAAFSTVGVWGEDQLTLGSRLTLTFGLRFDRMKGTSSDEDAIDNTLNATGATIQGLGTMFTWNVLSPRTGLNVKLTGDGKTVLRGTYGRAYRQILLNELDLVHPGIATVTQMSYDPATRSYSRFVSAVNSTSNIGVDRDMTAPRSDTYSIGVDRQLLTQVAVNVSYVRKRGDNLIGWRDVGGEYAEGTTVLPDGRSLTVFRLVNAPSQRRFLRTNRPEYFDNYDGLVASLTKRLSNRWQGQLNLTLSKSEGLRLTGNTGQDPNDLTNATGRLNPTDRPVMLTANASYDIPRIDVRISGNYQNVSNLAWAPFASVTLPQGRRNINIDVPGTVRADRINTLYLRLNKVLAFPGKRRLELMANVVNALQSKTAAGIGTANTTFITLNYFSSTYAIPNSWVQPRQLYLGARLTF